MKSRRFLVTVFLLGSVLTLVGLGAIRMDITSNAYGVIQYKDEIVIFAPQHSRIALSEIEPNSPVTKGQAIVELRNAELEMEIHRLEQQLLQTKYDLEMSRIKMEEFAITGAMPELQDIESINALQAKISEYADLIEANDNTSLKENLIARKLYYQEGIDRIQDELSMVEAKRLQRWKEGGLEDLISRRVSVKSKHLEAMVASLETKLNLLREEQQQLLIVSPFDGKVIDTYYRYPNEIKERGDPIVKLANPESGFQVKAYILEKNIDLVRKGMKVRMESQVYQSLLEGYLYGTVSEIIDRRDVKEPHHTTQAFFEVLVDIDDYPHKPVHGSRVKIEILLGRGSVVSALLNRPFGERGESE